MLILASLSGIQDYLFDVRESGGGQARTLRHRSFRIQLMCECVALRLLEAVRLPFDRLVFSAAGKLCIDADGLSAVGLDAARQVAAQLEQDVIAATHGRLRLSVVVEDRSGTFADRFARAGRALARTKVRPLATSSSHRWTDGSLVLRQLRDADAESSHDAALGKGLVQARWLTIATGGGTPSTRATEVLGYRIGLETQEPAADAGLVSCSNLAQPMERPRSQNMLRCFHPRRLARHVPCDDSGQPIEFLQLANRARGASLLAVLKADVDSLGVALAATLQSAPDRADRSLRRLSHALDTFFSEAIEAEQRRSPWNLIYTVFSGGDDLLVVGPWDVVLDFAGHLQRLFSRRFGTAAADAPAATPLTMSGGAAIVKPRYPVHLAAQQAEDLLDLAKGERAPRATHPKNQCAALGGLWKWTDHDSIIAAGRRLADWVDAGIVQRGWLHTLLQLSLLRRNQAGPEFAGAHPAVATSRLVYHVARNWAPERTRPQNDRQRAENEARAWIDTIAREFDRFETSNHVPTIHLPVIVRYALLASRSGGSED